MSFAGARPILAEAGDAEDFMARMASGNVDAEEDVRAPMGAAAGHETPRVPVAAHWPEADAALAVPLAHALRIPQDIIEAIMEIMGVTLTLQPKNYPTSPRHC